LQRFVNQIALGGDLLAGSLGVIRSS